ncbi:MAG: hypothetical protein IKU64_07660 [Bacteroides sp.]|nr:hypothetical protein [Bacteroides sp.]
MLVDHIGMFLCRNHEVFMQTLCTVGSREVTPYFLMLYVLRSQMLLKSVIGCCMLPGAWLPGLAFIPINLYNGERGFIQGTVWKYCFYAFYPVHLLVLYWIRG